MVPGLPPDHFAYSVFVGAIPLREPHLRNGAGKVRQFHSARCLQSMRRQLIGIPVTRTTLRLLPIERDNSRSVRGRESR